MKIDEAISEHNRLIDESKSRKMISVIVPVYNVGALLDDCVASVLAQTLTDFECILVDDGSTDGSGALCDAWALRDSRVRVIHKTNGGLSDARNAGLDVAQGACIAFVDSDDRLLPKTLESLWPMLEYQGFDVAVGSVLLHDMKTGEERPYAPLSTPYPKGILDQLFNVAAWNKLYRRSVFESRRYTKGIKFEDVPVWADILFSGATVAYVNEDVYVYNVNRAGSIVTTRDYRGYPAAWAAQREALKSHGQYSQAVAADFVCRIALKFIQAYNLSGKATRAEFYRLTQAFFRDCGVIGLGHERGAAVSLAAYLHYRACCVLPHGAYELLFWFERLIASPKLNAMLRRRLQK